MRLVMCLCSCSKNAANALTGFGINPLNRKFIKMGLIYITTTLFWGSILYNIIKNLNSLNISINNGDRVSDMWLYIGGLLTMFPLTVFFTYLLGNRFFCKYVCPIGGLQSLIAKFSLLKIKIDHSKCINCKICSKNCQMSVNIDHYIASGDPCVRDGNCIVCGDCIDKCPKKALKFGLIESNKKLSKKPEKDKLTA